MKQLKFNTNAKALLEKTKVSTIRKAYKYSVGANGEIGGRIDKPCKYKVGEILEVVWTGNTDYLSLDDINELSGRKVKINSIEKIEIVYDTFLKMCGVITETIQTEDKIANATNKVLKKIWKPEGFNNRKNLENYFLSYAPEIKERPMPFWLIRFEWVGSER